MLLRNLKIYKQVKGQMRNWKKQQNPMKRITQFTDEKQQEIEFGQDVL